MSVIVPFEGLPTSKTLAPMTGMSDLSTTVPVTVFCAYPQIDTSIHSIRKMLFFIDFEINKIKVCSHSFSLCSVCICPRKFRQNLEESALHDKGIICKNTLNFNIYHYF